MCGIVGLFGPPDNTRGWLTAETTAMAGTLRHRGPDDEGVWADEAEGIGLGHRRLAVLDVSPLGHQPMLSASGRWVISFNGEVYNFAELHRDLSARGYRFRGHSDTEVLVNAVDHWGVAPTLRRLNAMFALALWDRLERRLYLARDRLGEKPLYYAWAGPRIAFASELKAIRALRDFRATVDPAAVALYMRHNCIPAPYAIYQGSGKLLPGQYLTVDAEALACRRLKAESYWSPVRCAEDGQSRRIWDPREAVEEVSALLHDAVRLRMTADVPVGSLLSGGVDSSLVTSAMAAQGGKVRTFTVGFDDTGYDESGDAARVAHHLGTDHTDIRVTPREILEVVPRLADLYDEPFADSSQLPTALVARLARDHVTVVLSGDGGDELFAGYNRHAWIARTVPRLVHIPRSARRIAGRGMAALAPATVESAFRTAGRVVAPIGRIRNPSVKLAKAAAVLDIEDTQEIYLRLISHWPGPSSVVRDGVEPPTLVTDHSTHPQLVDPVDRLLYLDLVTYLPDDILTKVDRATMAVGLEARVPLLDHRMVELAWRLPLAHKLRDGRSKWVLRSVLERSVPRELFERPKMGFGVPLAAWLRQELRPWAEDLLAPSALKAGNLFDPATVRATWAEHLSGRDHSYALWDVIVYQDWASRWLP
jgi:asparagine synthase (glutamine-hydrolysing)